MQEVWFCQEWCGTGFSGRFDTENNENRKLAEFPEVNLESLGDFPEQFEAYYKDHVPFKNDLVKFCNFIDTEFFRNTKDRGCGDRRR